MEFLPQRYLRNVQFEVDQMITFNPARNEKCFFLEQPWFPDIGEAICQCHAFTKRWTPKILVLVSLQKFGMCSSLPGAIVKWSQTPCALVLGYVIDLSPGAVLFHSYLHPALMYSIKAYVEGSFLFLQCLEKFNKNMRVKTSFPSSSEF